MRIIDDHQRVIALRELADAGQRSEGPVHRKHAVRDDHPCPRWRSLTEPRFKFRQIAVGVSKFLRLAQTDAVDDGGVIECIGNHGVRFAQQGLKKSAVGIETGGIQHRVLGAKKSGQARLQFPMNLLRAADEADRGHAKAIPVERLVRRLDHGRVIRQPQVIVGAQVDQFTALTGEHDGALRRAQLSLHLEQALLAKFIQGRRCRAVKRCRLQFLQFPSSEP